MALDFPDRAAVFNTALGFSEQVRHGRWAGITSCLHCAAAERRAITRRLARLQLYVCGDPEVELEPWMLEPEGRGGTGRG